MNDTQFNPSPIEGWLVIMADKGIVNHHNLFNIFEVKIIRITTYRDIIQAIYVIIS